MQRLGGFRIGEQCRQIFRPQLEKLSREIVCFAHRRQYTAADRAWHPSALPMPFDEANAEIRCIVA
jgi:hypothetical protein